MTQALRAHWHTYRGFDSSVNTHTSHTSLFFSFSLANIRYRIFWRYRRLTVTTPLSNAYLTNCACVLYSGTRNSAHTLSLRHHSRSARSAYSKSRGVWRIMTVSDRSISPWGKKESRKATKENRAREEKKKEKESAVTEYATGKERKKGRVCRELKHAFSRAHVYIHARVHDRGEYSGVAFPRKVRWPWRRRGRWRCCHVPGGRAGLPGVVTVEAWRHKREGKRSIKKRGGRESVNCQ